MVITQGMWWEISICDCGDWKQIIPVGERDIVFLIVFYFMLAQG